MMDSSLAFALVRAISKLSGEKPLHNLETIKKFRRAAEYEVGERALRND